MSRPVPARHGSLSVLRIFVVCAVTVIGLGLRNTTAATRPASATAPTSPGNASIISDVRARIAANVVFNGAPAPKSAERATQAGARARASAEASIAGDAIGSVTPAAPASSSVWRQLGPSNAGFEFNGSQYSAVDSGRANEVRIAPGSADTVYIGTAGGGIWKTTNMSAASPTWVPIGDNLPALSIGSFDLDPTNPQRIIAGLGDPFDSVSVGGSVVQSTDGGATWTAPVGIAGATNVRDLRIDPSNPQIVLVAADSGVFRSGDGGASFSAVTLPGLSQPQGWSVAYGGVTAGLSTWVAAARQANGNGTLFRSTDAGNNWVSLDASMPVSATRGRIKVAAGNASGGTGATTMYAQVANTVGTSQIEVLKSVNGGASWVEVATASSVPTNPTTGSADCINMDVAGTQSFYNLAIAVDPTNANDVIVGGQLCSARSVDGGTTWSLVSHWLPSGVDNATANGLLPYVHADWHGAAIVALAGGAVRTISGADGGVAVSDDVFSNSVPEHITWRTPNRGLVTFQFYGMTSGDPATSDTNVIFGGTQDNGTRLRDPDPAKPFGTYNQVIGGDGIDVAIARPTIGGPVYWASVEGNRRYCQPAPANSNCNAGSNTVFHSITTGFTEPFLIRYSTLPADSHGTVLSATTNRVISIDSTTHVSQSLFLAPGSTLVRNIEAAPFMSMSGKRLYGAAMSGGAIEVGVDTGFGTPITWTAAPTPLGGSAVSSRMLFTSTVAFPHAAANLGGSADGQAYLVGSTAPLLADNVTPVPDAEGRLLRTIDGGSTWTAFHGNGTGHDLPNVAVYTASFDPSDATDQTIYVGNELGLYRSADGGNTWNRYGVGLPNVGVRHVVVAADGSFIRVATFGRGMWQLTGDQFAPASTTVVGTDHATVPSGVIAHLTATVGPPDAAGSVQFSDGAAALGTVPVVNGVATFRFSSTAGGIHHLTATFIPTQALAPSNGLVDVTVSAALVTGVSVTPASANVAIGATTSFQATGHFSDGIDRDVTGIATWSTVGHSVAIVGSATGIVAGVGAGTTTLTATVSTFSDAKPVTVGHPPSITTPSGATFSEGLTNSITVSSVGDGSISLTRGGTLPAGLTFSDQGNGTAVLSGVAASGSAGPYPLTLTAISVFGHSDQAFTLTVLVGQPVALAGATRFVALSPFRLLDSRVAADVTAGLPVASGGHVDLQVTGRGGVPATNVAAVVLNVTAANAIAPGFVTVWPTSQPQPQASNLNITIVGQNIANLVTVRLGAGGHVSLFSQSGTGLVVDVAGYYEPVATSSRDGRYTPLPPTRILDTRIALGVPGTTPAPADAKIDLAVAGHGGVPSAGAAAVVLNVTAAQSLGAGFVTVWPAGNTRPTASTLNVTFAGQNIANLVIVPIGANGSVSLYTQTGTHLIADVAGWFGDNTQQPDVAGLFVPVDPVRVLDTRSALGVLTTTPVPPGTAIVLPIAGHGGTPATGIGAVVLNVTAAQATAPGFITVWPSDQPQPTASNLNVTAAGQNIPNLVSVSVGNTGSVSLYTQTGTHLVADIAGYYTGEAQG